ncbi:hypothetical protein [Mycobacterium attenuatum]|nr:hypothetical protein [Mycobacterium attenuatum]
MSDHEYNVAKAAAYRLLLAQLNQDTEAVDVIGRELEPDILERPDRLRAVLAVLLGVATAVMSNHFGGPAAAMKVLEPKLAEALDALHDDQV